MTRSSPPQLSMSSGEISPLLYARQDYQRFQTGLAICRGYLPLRQGGVTRAPGTWFRGNTRSNRRARLIDFEFARNDALALEFTHLAMRVWRYGALVEKNGNPYVLATPFAEADLDNLQWVQSADVIYIASGTHPVQRLARMALDDWSIGAADFTNGPFLNENDDKNKTVEFVTDGLPGTLVNIQAAGFDFDTDDLGALLQVKPTDAGDVPLWVGNQAVTVGDLIRYDGNVYELTAGTNTGVNPPIHLEGSEVYDAADGTTWEFVSDGVGLVKIVNFAGPIAIGVVIKRIPPACVGTPCYRFSFGAWSPKNGYPAAIEIYDQRLALAASALEPRTIWFSTAGLLQDFEPSVDPDGAFTYRIGGQSSINRILWLKSGQRGLHIGALGEEYSTRSVAANQIIGPTTAAFGLDSSTGSSAVRPVAPDGRPIFVDRSGTRIIEMAYTYENDANMPRELSLPAEHIGQLGLQELAWQNAPLRLLWCRLETGDLAVMVYDQAEEVLGWAVYPVAGGIVEAMAVTTGIDGSTSILTLQVRREINGQTRRSIEEQSLFYGVIAGDDPIATANHLFCAAAFIANPARSIFDVAHLAGQTVYAWTNEGTFGPFLVPSDGQLDIGVNVTRAQIGLFDETHRVRFLDMPVPARDGSSIGRRKKINKGSGIVVHRTAGCLIRTVESDPGRPERFSSTDQLIKRQSGAAQTEAVSGPMQTNLLAGPAQSVTFEILPDGPAPATILALVPRVEEVTA